MKRLLCILLALILVASMFACGGSGDQEQAGTDLAGKFSIGYGKADISPQQSVYLRGYGEPTNERMSTGVSEPLYTTCVAITDETGNTALLISLDLLNCDRALAQPLRKEFSEQYGIPYDNIMVCCSHNHSGPDSGDNAYHTYLADQIRAAVKMAMESRLPATMETTFTRPEGFNFVRHYLLIDGTFMGEAVGTIPNNQIYGHYGKADNLLQLVRFNREGDKPVVLMNWQGHPRGTDPNPHTVATPNYPGIMRQTVEEGLDCYGAFFLSGSGNVNNNSQIKSEVSHANYMELGKALGEEAIAAAANFKPVNTGNIQAAVTYLDELGNEKADTGIPLHALSFGDVAFAFAPFEIFDTNAMGVKDNSDFKMTFYSSCSNESHSYLPTDPSFDWVHHYEVRVTKFPKGTAQKVEDLLSGLLDKCFAASGNTVTEKEPGYVTPEFVPVNDGITYTNPAAGDTSAYIPVENGFCQIMLLDGAVIRQFLTINAEVAQQVLTESTVQILRNEQDVIVGVAK